MSDKQFYKFKKVNARTLTGLLTKSFYAPSLDKLNDHFEDRFGASKNRQFVGHFEEVLSNPSEFIDEISKKTGIISVSMSENDCGKNILENSLMWAHYGDSHHGIAIGLMEEDCTCGINHFFPVDYIDENQESVDNKYEAVKADYQAQNSETKNKLLKCFFGYKFRCWEYENEYRCLMEPCNTYHKRGIKINEIVFGYKVAEDIKRSIWKIFKDTVVYKEVVNNDGFLKVEDSNPPQELRTGSKILLHDTPQQGVE